MIWRALGWMAAMLPVVAIAICATYWFEQTLVVVLFIGFAMLSYTLNDKRISIHPPSRTVSGVSASGGYKRRRNSSEEEDQ